MSVVEHNSEHKPEHKPTISHMNTVEAKKSSRPRCYAPHEPLSINAMKKLFVEEGDGEDMVGADTIKLMLEELRGDWTGKGSKWSACRPVGAFRAGPR